jgi:hypothetical protein
LIFLFLFSYVASRRLSIYSPFAMSELWLIFCVAAFSLNEIYDLWGEVRNWILALLSNAAILVEEYHKA